MVERDLMPPVRVRPRQVLFTILSQYVLPMGAIAVATRTFVDALEGIGVSHRATRATLNRVVADRYLERRRVGRQAFYAITSAGHHTLQAMQWRLQAWVERVESPSSWWTLLSFSIPESRRHDRYLLRTELAWKGFGALRDGLWLAPGTDDVDDLLAELDLQDHVEVLHARPRSPDQARSLVERIWNLDELRGRCEAFLTRWDERSTQLAGADELSRHLLLLTEWRQLLRVHPHIPFDDLPSDWPIRRCAELFDARDAELAPAANALFEQLLEVVDLDDAAAMTD
jgi:phenylacetic acid degradation operon negative regulatory protein